MYRKIVSAGLLCLDITPVFKSSEKKDIQNFFIPGSMIEMDKADIHTGGSVANSGLAFKIFGADVTLMGKIGNDYFGKLVEDIISKYGSQHDLIVSSDCDTSYTIILAPPGIDRIFLHYPGADDSFCYDDLDFHKIEGADLFHFGYPTIMKRMYENNGSELIRIFKKAKELGILTSLDMTAIDSGSDAAKIDWISILKTLMPYVDFFVPSAEELCFLINRERYHEWIALAKGRDISQVIDIEQDIKPMAQRLISWGARVVLIKCGTPGMYLRTADKHSISSMGPDFRDWADLDIFEYSYEAERYCSGTGAGDVSLAAFLTAALYGYEPGRCLQLATGAGACCVSAYDALSGLLSFDDMIKKIDSGWKKRTPGWDKNPLI